MSTSVVPINGIESALMMGDLAKLTPQDRLRYYQQVCESMKLNPLTRPFDYINLNGKLTLYAKKDCTDQLRSRDSISITIPSREVHEGVYVVTARAATPKGRVDESTGAVAIEGLKGENKSNAMMKAETKAKRRVTLSICGMGILDESEIDSTNGTRVQVDMATGEIISGHRQAQQQVAAELIEQGTRQLEATKSEVVEDPKNPGAARKVSTDFATLKKFGALKGQIGEFDYYRILRDMYGVEHANEIIDPEIAKKCIRTLKGWLNISEPWVRLENRDKARFDALLESEGCLTIAEAVKHPDSAGILLRIELEMSTAKKPETTLSKLAALCASDEDLFWRVAGNNGCGRWSDVESQSPPAQDKLLHLVEVEKELNL